MMDYLLQRHGAATISTGHGTGTGEKRQTLFAADSPPLVERIASTIVTDDTKESGMVR
jgi:hypothetical protein